MDANDDLPEHLTISVRFIRDPLAYSRPGQEARLPKDRPRAVRFKGAAKRLLRDYGIELVIVDVQAAR